LARIVMFYRTARMKRTKSTTLLCVVNGRWIGAQKRASLRRVTARQSFYVTYHIRARTLWQFTNGHELSSAQQIHILICPDCERRFNACLPLPLCDAAMIKGELAAWLQTEPGRLAA
jgi:hypothetical protein